MLAAVKAKKEEEEIGNVWEGETNMFRIRRYCLDQAKKEGIHEKATFECRPEGNEEASFTRVWAKSISGRGKSRTQSPRGRGVRPVLERIGQWAGVQ